MLKKSSRQQVLRKEKVMLESIVRYVHMTPNSVMQFTTKCKTEKVGDQTFHIR